MLYGFILVIHIIVCFVLIAVILFQAGRGGGLADTFGGGAAQSFFGTRGAVYLTRATTICAAIFMMTSLSLAALSSRQGRSLMENLPAVQSGTKVEEKKATPETPAVPSEQKAAPKPETGNQR